MKKLLRKVSSCILITHSVWCFQAYGVQEPSIDKYQDKVEKAFIGSNPTRTQIQQGLMAISYLQQRGIYDTRTATEIKINLESKLLSLLQSEYPHDIQYVKIQASLPKSESRKVFF
jgi:hypothetical protein